MTSLEQEITSLISEIKGGKRLISVQGLGNQGFKAFFLLLLQLKLSRVKILPSFLLITSDLSTGEEIYHNLNTFLRNRGVFTDKPSSPLPLFFLPSPELLPYEAINPLEEIVGERLNILLELTRAKEFFLITPLDSLLQKTLAPEFFQKNLIHFERGDSLERELILEYLLEQGYRRENLVENCGEFSIRGAIIDIFAANLSRPIRMEFEGDTLESIREFDPFTQISTRILERVIILPPHEHLNPEREAFCLKPLLSYLPPQTIILLDEAVSLKKMIPEYFSLIRRRYEKARGIPPDSPFLKKGAPKIHPPLLSPEKLFITLEELTLFFRTNQCLELNGLSILPEDSGSEKEIVPSAAPRHHLHSASLRSYRGRLRDFFSDLKNWLKRGEKVIIVSFDRGEEKRLKEALAEEEIGGFTFIPGRLSRGFKIPSERLIVFSPGEIFGSTTKKRGPRRGKKDLFFSSLRDLNPGDYVVHSDYGIGRYLGIKEISVLENREEFLEIEYAHSERLYLPMDRIYLLQRYYASEEIIPTLNSLRGSSWQRVKQRVKTSLRTLAKEIIQINALRELSRRKPYSPEGIEYKEFAAGFEFEETEDQLKVIAEINRDLEGDKPMDRLVCGDVGYGKTEVAIRAAFRVLRENKQVAILVPTTILAFQHFQTFSRRFASFPLTIEVLSRFKTVREQKQIIKKIESGEIDLIIGTHRLLQKDLKFKDLGLIIIDEEQRFGVAHKENFKKLRAAVDILTLTATPIPRTLHLSLLGIREISIIETPPLNRQAIRTFMARFSKELIKEAILREKERGGQVFFVHNRVQDLERIAREVGSLVPKVRFALAHGQMPEKELTKSMLKFMGREIDLLFCTSIIESGLDIPTANTIIINSAEKFGLADLYQLRGRVGREKHQAYAYFLISNPENLNSRAKKRLEAIEELSELGAGFRLAARDMEIRGAGNILGYEQSGHIALVGFDLYSQLMRETVAELKGEIPEETIEPALKLGDKGFIPRDYIPVGNQRIDFYRRFYLLSEEEELEELKKELYDLYGKTPQEVNTFLINLELKLLARKLKIEKVESERDFILLHFHPQTPLSPLKLKKLIAENKGELTFKGENILKLRRLSSREENRLQSYERIKKLLLKLARG